MSLHRSLRFAPRMRAGCGSLLAQVECPGGIVGMGGCREREADRARRPVLREGVQTTGRLRILAKPRHSAGLPAWGSRVLPSRCCVATAVAIPGCEAICDKTESPGEPAINTPYGGATATDWTLPQGLGLHRTSLFSPDQLHEASKGGAPRTPRAYRELCVCQPDGVREKAGTA